VSLGGEASRGESIGSDEFFSWCRNTVVLSIGDVRVLETGEGEIIGLAY
jgi:hypothetical protein